MSRVPRRLFACQNSSSFEDCFSDFSTRMVIPEIKCLFAIGCRGGQGICAAEQCCLQHLPIRLGRNNSHFRASDVLMDTINSLVGKKLVFQDTNNSLTGTNICNSFVKIPETEISFCNTSLNFQYPLGTKSYSDLTPCKLLCSFYDSRAKEMPLFQRIKLFCKQECDSVTKVDLSYEYKKLGFPWQFQRDRQLSQLKTRRCRGREPFRISLT